MIDLILPIWKPVDWSSFDVVKKVRGIIKSAKQIKGLPKNPKLANIKWSPDQTKIAMTNTKEEGVELWYIDLEKLTAKKLTGPKLISSII